MSNVFLDSNENLYNPYKNLVAEKLKSLDIENIFKYPDNNYLELREAYAKYAGVGAENIIAGNGSDEMLGMIIGNFINKDDVFATLSLDFSMYDFYVRENQGIIEKYDMTDDFDINDLSKFIKDKKVKLFIFSNPNNPTGRIIKESDIKKLLRENTETKFVVDEAYYEFYGNSMATKINGFSNLIVTRTLSKAFGLASLRVGFLMANAEIINYLLNYKVPYNINRLSEYFAIEALKDTSIMSKSLSKIIKSREVLKFELNKIQDKDFKFYESYANYIYLYGQKVRGVAACLEQSGLILRVFDDERIRVTVPREDQLEKLIACLKENVV